MDAADPSTLFAGVQLQEGERLLWQGRPGFGISRFELKRLLRGGVSVGATGFGVVVAYSFLTLSNEMSLELVIGTLVAAFFLAIVPTFAITLAVLLAKVSQASTAATAIVVFCLPLLALLWVGLVLDYGLASAFVALVTHPVGICFWTLGVPLVPAVVHLGRKVLTQVHTRYTLTNQRYVETLDRRGGVRVVQQGTVPTGWIQVRAIPLGKGARGHVAIGTGRARVLFRFVDHPKLVVEEIRRELGQLGAKPPSSSSAGDD